MSRFSLETIDSIAKADRYPERKPISHDIQFKILLHTYILLVELKSFRIHTQTVVLDIKFLSRTDKMVIFLESLQLKEYPLLLVEY